jgi:hypothetical protein
VDHKPNLEVLEIVYLAPSGTRNPHRPVRSTVAVPTTIIGSGKNMLY